MTSRKEQLFLLALATGAAKLGQHTFGRLGVKERNVQTLGAFAGSLVDEAYLFLLGLGECLSYILHGVGDVVDTLATFLDEACNGALGAGGLEELDFGLTHLEESGFHLLVGHLLDVVTLQAKYLLVVGNSLLKAFDCDTEMLDVRNSHSFISFKRLNVCK